MHASEAELKAFIIDSGLVTKKELDAAIEDAAVRGQSLSDTLISRGSLTEDSLRRTKAYLCGIPFVNLKEYHLPVEVLSLIPEPIARTHNLVAYKKDQDTLEVALLDIDDLSAIDSVRQKTGLRILPRLTSTDSIKHSLLIYQKSLKERFGDIISTEAARLLPVEDATNLAVEEFKKMSEDPSVVRIVDTLLRHASVQNASIVHIEPAEAEARVRYRIGGILHDAMTIPKFVARRVTVRLKALAGLISDSAGVSQEGGFIMKTDGEHVAFRVSILLTPQGEKIVVRLLPQAAQGFMLETLGFNNDQVEHVHHALNQKAGVLLVAGADKVPILYTFLDMLNQPHLHLSTVEDPIEQQLKRITQVQVNPDIGLTFENGLRALMRQDADVIMVSDIRTAEMAALVANAALSGRLVLAGMNAIDARDALARLRAFGMSPSLIASLTHLVIGQQTSEESVGQGGVYDMLTWGEVQRALSES